MSTENALLTILAEKINNDTLVLPTLPAVALKVRKAADDPNVNLGTMGEVIAQDPSLSARMIKIANSAYLGRSVKVTSLNQAVTRIGLSQIKNMATALAMEQLFVSKNELIKRAMSQAWERTVEVVANSLALLKTYSQENKKHSMSMDTMTLAALIHNIGVLPILTEAERHAEVFANETFLQTAIDKLAGRIGAKIMREWGFGDEFAHISENWRDLGDNQSDIGYMDFVRMGAVLTGELKNEKDAVFNMVMEKSMLTDVHQLKSDEFTELKNNAKQIFA